MKEKNTITIKLAIILSLGFLMQNHKTAAQATLNWVHHLGSSTFSDIDNCYQMKTDSDGNVYIVGTVDGVMDMDPGSGVHELVSASTAPGVGSYNAYVAKYAADGTYLWASMLSSNQSSFCRGIDLDADENPIVIGSFGGSIDFDPSAGEHIAASLGSMDAFVGKYSKADGTMLWGFNYGNAGSDYSESIRSDHNGNFYIAGGFGLTVDFDPGPGVIGLTSVGCCDNQYFVKYDDDGNCVWAKILSTGSFASDLWTWGRGIELDAAGNIIILRNYYGTADFDPSDATFEMTMTPGSGGYADIFLAKYTSDGDFIWAKSIGGTGTDEAYAVTSDAGGNIYVAGNFRETADMDPGDGELIFSAQDDTQDMFLSKFDGNGILVWSKYFGGELNDDARAISVDPDGNIYFGGVYTASVDFDPGSGSAILNSGFAENLFVAVYNNDGVFLNVSDFKSADASSEAMLSDMYVMNDILYVCGIFDATLDMDCTDEELIFTTFGNQDSFFGSYNVAEIVDGVSEDTPPASFAIYPNPASEVIQVISTPSFQSSTASTVKIFSAEGKLVLQTSLVPQLDISSLPCGVYYLSIGDAYQKLVKQ